MDTFESYRTGLESPARDAKAVTPANDTDLPSGVCRALYIGGDGNVSLITPEGTTVSFIGLVAGTILPVRAARVRVTGTTATNLVALY